MSDSQDEQWSPARSPYAIAVSQSWWALRAVRLFAADAKKADGPEQQIYGRQVFGQLRALRRCAEMQAKELGRLGVAEGDRVLLDRGIEEFDAAVPAAKPARDILEHFDEYARGEGRLQRNAIRDLGLDVDEAAAMYWGGGYDPATEQITEGPFAITIPEVGGGRPAAPGDIQRGQSCRQACIYASSRLKVSRGGQREGRDQGASISRKTGVCAQEKEQNEGGTSVARIEEVNHQHAVRQWLKRCAEHAGYTVIGMPTLTPLAGNKGAFGQSPVDYMATIMVRGGEEKAANISEAMEEVPPDGFGGVTGSPEDVTTFHFRLSVKP